MKIRKLASRMPAPAHGKAEPDQAEEPEVTAVTEMKPSSHQSAPTDQESLQLDARVMDAPPATFLPLAANASSLALGSAFWRPQYLKRSPWIEHVPFAFWIVEASRPHHIVELDIGVGTSYFALCQAVERLGLDTACYGFVAPDGDASDVETSPQNRYNDASYARFSTLLARGENDTRLFDDGTVDLLSINGIADSAALLATLREWLPKLSNQGIVLVPGTHLRAPGNNLVAACAELRAEYPTFEFIHGGGLLAVSVGNQHNEFLAQLFGARTKPAHRATLQEIFARLGTACRASLQAQEAESRVSALEEEIQSLQRQVEIGVSAPGNDLPQPPPLAAEIPEALAADVPAQPEPVQAAASGPGTAPEIDPASTQGDFEAATKLAELEARIDAMTAENTELRTRLAAERAKVSHVEYEKVQAEAAMQEASKRVESLKEHLQLADAQVQTAESKVKELEARMSAALADKETKAEALRNSLTARFSELALLTQRVEELEAQVEQKDEQARLVSEELAAIKRTKLWRYANAFGKNPGEKTATPKGKRGQVQAQIEFIRESGQFDTAWYLKQYPDVAKARVDPVAHYVKHGAAEGRNPNPRFDTRAYAAKVPEAGAAGINPFAHYLKHR